MPAKSAKPTEAKVPSTKVPSTPLLDPPPPSLTPGYRTTEFWLSLVSIIAATVLVALGKLDADAWTGMVGAVGVGYSLSRGLAK